MPRFFSTELQFQKRFEESCVGSNDILFSSSTGSAIAVVYHHGLDDWLRWLLGTMRHFQTCVNSVV